MRSARIVSILHGQRLPPRPLVRGQRSTGVQGQTLEIEIEVERERAPKTLRNAIATLEDITYWRP
jgi:hypothetical protein